MFGLARQLVQSKEFESIILGLILLNAVMMGFETSPVLASDFERWFLYTNVVLQLIFIIEIALRLLAADPPFRGFFSDNWNTFDFIVVAISLVPAVGSFALVARVLRVFRALRLVSGTPRLRSALNDIFAGLPSLLTMAFILLIVTYVYALLGYYLFADLRPERWGTLLDAGRSLFLLLTFQEISPMLSELRGFGFVPPLYIMSFLGFGVLMFCNLIAVVVEIHLRSPGLLGEDSSAVEGYGQEEK